MERKVKEGGGSLLTKRIDLRGRERSPSADPSSPTRFCPWCKRSRALSVEKWRGICSKRRGMDVYGYHQDQLHAFPSLIAVVKHFTTIFSRTDFYPSSVKERIFARNCLLSLSLSPLFLCRTISSKIRGGLSTFRRWKYGCHVEVTLSRLVIRRVTVFIGIQARS